MLKVLEVGFRLCDLRFVHRLLVAQFSSEECFEQTGSSFEGGGALCSRGHPGGLLVVDGIYASQPLIDKLFFLVTEVLCWPKYFREKLYPPLPTSSGQKDSCGEGGGCALRSAKKATSAGLKGRNFTKILHQY